ncbi:hypothetical protein [Sandaracinus amylolyticus]|uniref:hypothetical protein n=1 Tax=Sandaracinus amylolyticus TaxID=927083 RepID=UPI001F3AB697|nr:hypothetical protein [Sandaracinus amylolyticus]UJR86795.1 Hypothetical protein I5071_88960 [Sandaracinus amylolyticus]
MHHVVLGFPRARGLCFWLVSSLIPKRFVSGLVAVLVLGSTGCFTHSPIDDSGRQRARASQRAALACGGLAPELVDRTLADAPHLLLHAEAITAFGGNPRRLQTLGVRMHVDNDLGLDAALAERVLSCQSARYAASGESLGARDPLAVGGLVLRIEKVDEKIELVLRARDPRDAEEAVRRASALMAER